MGSTPARIRRAVETLPNGCISTLEEFILQPEKKVTWCSVEVFSTMKGFSYSEIENESVLHQVQELHVRTMSLRHMMRAKQLTISIPERQGKRKIDESDLAFLLAQN